VDQDQFRLIDDETMRRLRTLAAAPGEFEWRVELLAKLARMDTQRAIDTRAILKSQSDMAKILKGLTPVELAKAINREIDEREKAKNSKRYLDGWKTFRNHVITAATSIVVAYLLWRLKK
jgi:hypothetical protein